MSQSIHRQTQEERKRLKDHKIQAEDERGWAGQHGQHPVTEEEKNYRPHGEEHSPAGKKD